MARKTRTTRAPRAGARKRRSASSSSSSSSSSSAKHRRAGMSTASKVAIASAAGLLAATAAGLATTKKGRRLSRQMEQKISPMMRRRWHNVVNAVEESLAEHGVLRMIPARVRDAVVQRLCINGADVAAGVSGSSRDTRGRRSSSTRATRRRTVARSH